MAPAADADLSEYYPEPFPKNIPTIHLEKLSLRKLLEGDKVLAQTLFRVLCNEGFFYLDLTTHPQGQQFLDDAHQLHRVAKEVFMNVPMEDKLAFKTGDPTKSHLDNGYKCVSTDAQGQPDKSEFVNISTYRLFNDVVNYEQELPVWLRSHTELYRSFTKNGNAIGQSMLKILERELHLQPGEFVNMHQLSDASGDFLRLFRYPAPKDNRPRDVPGAPAHTDATSITLLFNWQGGLQIARPKESGSGGIEKIDRFHEGDEWLHVKPEPGHVIVNLGDPMVVFTNGVLKSGRHQVVTPPGRQAMFDRYSVLTNLRPANGTLMRPLKSDVIPLKGHDQDSEEQTTALEWSLRKVKAILDRMAKGSQ